MLRKMFDDEDLNQQFDHMERCTLTIAETINLIVSRKLSVARFGDGEIRMVNSLVGCAFENSSYYGTSKLRTILSENHENLLVCLNGKATDEWWTKFWTKEFPAFSKFVLPRVYGNTFVSRKIFSHLKQEGIDKWKSVWDQRKVIFITGDGSRFDFGHVLFDNIAESEVFLSKATHAIKDIPRVLAEVSQKDKDVLFLISLGPAATILAYELTLLGYQAIDIGHITSCYDSVFHGAPLPEKLPLKKKKES
ncbi:hypothetical protein B9T31_16915 [Acinetobacter sp. ANC 4558]|uniref:GT-D fold domain-containing glycosyltransferase n=1 Tax=Acinetobacter sp. ANC 4558 TaxID=1977876 RepID=UPI000A3381FF|nr:GT-D fold domain-containing glycosyltransferase [Acinetobacter sp. ANC 4558]OTG79570.1 hypothetical protein B9T31_16915 [Acinetobacter sp. ANC 4558]